MHAYVPSPQNESRRGYKEKTNPETIDTDNLSLESDAAENSELRLIPVCIIRMVHIEREREKSDFGPGLVPRGKKKWASLQPVGGCWSWGKKETLVRAHMPQFHRFETESECSQRNPDVQVPPAISKTNTDHLPASTRMAILHWGLINQSKNQWTNRTASTLVAHSCLAPTPLFSFEL